MKWLVVCQALLCAGLVSGALLPPFLNCDGQGLPGFEALKVMGGVAGQVSANFYRALGSISTPFRQCCVSELLPNGCECFDVSPLSDYVNTAGLFKPQCPADLGLQFYLFTNEDDPNTPVVVKADMIDETTFDPSKETKFLVHGWGDYPFYEGYVRLRKAVLAAGDYNVFMLDWSRAAGHFDRNIFQSIASTRSAGAVMAQFILELKNKYGLKLVDLHLACFQMGVSVCAYAGKEIFRMEGEKIARITGCDAVGTGFEGFSKWVRIDKDDATFVDIIHTDGGENGTFALGTTMSVGDVDFRPNGGNFQPGCPVLDIDYFDVITLQPGAMKAACSHYRSIDIFISSIKDCQYKDPNNADCQMGWHATPACSGDVVIKTTGTAPFCEFEAGDFAKA